LSALSILTDFIEGKLPGRGAAGKTLPPAYRRLEPLPVHRLDQYTSGVFCMATNPAARQSLIEQLRGHGIKREYVAFVEGRARSPRGSWRQWLQLSPDELRQEVLSAPPLRSGGAQAAEAVTHYEVIDEYPVAGGQRWVTKLRLRLETGLKHQIRVQAASAGLPLVGDRTYNPSRWIEFPRQGLHAEVLELEHPEQPGKRISWTAALPKDLRELESLLRSGSM
jgi:23S rRNA pseudouridine1911/1915/1917 synthase